MATISIRRMTEDDLDQVSRLELALFTMAWSRSSFLFDVSDTKVSYPIVGTQHGRVVAYAVAWFVGDELHIGNIAVAAPKQGAGIGSQLLRHLMDEARRRGLPRASLEVRMSNVRAIRLYRKYGFKGVAIRKRYYADNGEDALVMLADIMPGGKPDGEADG